MRGATPPSRATQVRHPVQLVSMALQEPEAALVAPHLPGWKQIAVNHSQRCPVIVPDLPSYRRNLGNSFFARAKHLGEIIITRSQQPLANFCIVHKAPPAKGASFCLHAALPFRWRQARKRRSQYAVGGSKFIVCGAGVSSGKAAAAGNLCSPELSSIKAQ